MKKQFLPPEAELIFMAPHDIIRTSDGNGLEIKTADNEKGFGALVPLG